MSGPVRFALIGGGWRAEFFLRIARALPERFQVSRMLVRDAVKGAAIETRWHVPTYRRLEESLADNPLFAVVSVPWAVTPMILGELAERGVPALAETPPAPDLDGLVAVNRLTGQGARIQVAEQYAFQPLHAARLAIARSGRLGTISQAQVSSAHGYHGVSLIRKFLGATYENARISGYRFSAPLVAGPGRDSPPAEESVTQSTQVIASLDFGDRLGVYDFTGDQYFSWIRSSRVLVRGDRGEIHDDTVRYLQDFRTPITLKLLRQNTGEDGNLEGGYHKGILAGPEWAYRNPFIPGRLTDDEIAIATCLEKMADYARGGPDFYPLAEASQDHYLSMMIDQAVATGETLTTTTQPWAAFSS
ncbi:MAG: gfo/Idh/MocA family oxidoreductase [Armatimonadetes bacterium]|nr:gfo/Idh/MocA family oxidoreductase [Armatimonadota bacterium]